VPLFACAACDVERLCADRGCDVEPLANELGLGAIERSASSIRPSSNSSVPRFDTVTASDLEFPIRSNAASARSECSRISAASPRQCAT
jgi:hypothetical protein